MRAENISGFLVSPSVHYCPGTLAFFFHHGSGRCSPKEKESSVLLIGAEQGAIAMALFC